MQVEAKGISKRYNDQWILRKFSETIASGERVALSGNNGTGKSTLVKILTGFLSPTQGSVAYTNSASQAIQRSEIYKYISLASPYVTFEQDLTAGEIFGILTKHKSYSSPSVEAFLEKARLTKDADKYLRQYSDGMRQRFGLALALDCQSELLFLDEPTSYLDVDNKEWFYKQLKNLDQSRTIIIASNDKNDFQMTTKKIDSQRFIQKG